MKTIEIKLYSFNELSEEAKANAIEQHREKQDFYHLWDEGHKTAEKLHELFNSENKHANSWLEFSTSKIEDAVLELKGQRLRTWILNNYGKTLYKPKYIGSIEKEPTSRNPRIKTTRYKNGNTFNAYYSAVQKDSSCVLTGMCYDDDALKPMYDFIEKPNDKTLEDLIGDCFHALKKTIEDEIEYRQTDEAIAEDLQEGDEEFTEDGKRY